MDENISYVGVGMGDDPPVHIYGRETWQKILEGYEVVDDINPEWIIKEPQYILLHGDYGVGKEALLLSQAYKMYQGNYEFLTINGNDIDKDDLGQVYDEILENLKEDSCYLYIQNIEKLGEIADLSEFYIKLVLEAKEIKKEYDTDFIVTAKTEDENFVNSPWGKYFDVYEIDYPDQEDRKQYFTEILRSYMASGDFDKNIELLVDGTERFNYLELRSVVKRIRMSLRMKVIEGIKNPTADQELIEKIVDTLVKKETQPVLGGTTVIQAAAAVPVAQAAEINEMDLFSQTMGGEKKDTLMDNFDPLSIDPEVIFNR